MSLSNLRVLIVDDNASDRIIVQTMMMTIKVATAHTAENGAIAKEKLKWAADMSQGYDLVILDWNMPGPNGLKLLQFIRGDAQIKDSKVIIMTATSNRKIVEDAITNGANDFLVKPVELTLLQQKIEKIFP